MFERVLDLGVDHVVVGLVEGAPGELAPDPVLERFEGPQATDSGPGIPVPPAPLPGLGAEGCIALAGFFPVPESTVQDHLPPGFQPNNAFAGSSDPVTFLWVLGIECSHVRGDSLEVQRARSLDILLPVVPPDEYFGKGFGVYLLPLLRVTEDEGLASLYESWGFSRTLRGTVDVQVLSRDPLAPTLLVRAESDGFAISFLGGDLPPTAETEGGFQRMFAVTNGEVVGALDSEIFPLTTGQNTARATYAVTGDPGRLLPVPPAGHWDGKAFWTTGAAWNQTYVAFE